MKINKYVTVLLAVAAMASSFMSCNRDNDITGDPMADHSQNINGKQDFWIDFQLSNPGSLSEAAQARFIELRDTTIYGEKLIKIIEHPMYVTENVARDNFNKVAAIPAEANDIVQKIMIPTAKIQKVRDFSVTMTLSKDSMRTVMNTYTWNASEVISADDLN
jgi:hypothetical protein